MPLIVDKTARRAVLAVLFAGALSATAGYWLLVSEISAQTQAEFDIAARARFAALRSAVEVQLERVRLMRGFMQALRVDDEGTFDRAVAGTSSRDVALRALEWAPEVTASERADFEARVGFPITERDATGAMVRAGERARYFPVTFIDPQRSNEQAVGFDVLSEARRAEAVERALRTGRIAASAPISLVQGARSNGSVRLVGLVETPTRLRGLVAAVVEVDALAAAVTDDWGIELSITDRGAGAFSSVETGRRSGHAVQPWQDTLDVGGRTWSVTLRPSSGWLSRHRATRLWVVPLLILTLVVSTAFFILRIRHRARRLEAEAGRRRAVEQALRELNGTLEKRVAERTEEARREHAELVRARQHLEEGARQLRQAQKMEAFGQLAGGIAHDFNNMLVAVIGTADMALSDLPDGEHEGLREDLEEIKRVGQLAADLTRQLLAFSRQQALAPRPVDVSSLLRDVGGMSRRLLDASVNVHVEGIAEQRWALMDPTQLEQVLVNLVLNARDAMPAGGDLRLVAGAVDLDGEGELPAGAYVTIAVRDTGEGMPAEVVERIFEPFYTTKGVGHGTGLGLSTCLGIITQSGGSIAVESAPGEGSCFTLHLPAAAAPAPSDPVPQPSPPSCGGETILLVEDEAPVRALMSRVLRGAGYAVLEARDALDSSLIGAGRRIDLLLTDLSMPGMNGVDLALRLNEEQPDVRVLVVSGHPQADSRLGQGRYPFLPKPFTPSTLLRAVREALDGESISAGSHRGDRRSTP